MSSLIQQLGLDSTFFIQFLIYGIALFFLSQFYFKPFQKLLELRHKRLVEDREAAEKLVSQADSKFEEYRARLAAERATARAEYDQVIARTKKEESEILGNARAEAKKITQEAMESAQKQQDQVRRQLEADVDQMAKMVSERLLGQRE